MEPTFMGLTSMEATATMESTATAAMETTTATTARTMRERSGRKRDTDR
jgi:hypothetical protein